MSFAIKTMERRVADMITWFAGIQRVITDFVPGGSTRTKLEAIALEMERQDYQFYTALKKAIPTAIYNAFDFNLQAAIKAHGFVTFTAAAVSDRDIVIPAGTIVTTTPTLTDLPKKYVTAVVGRILVGETTVSIAVSAQLAGVNGNVSAGAITALQTTVSGISTVINPLVVDGGAEQETADARRYRFQLFIESLARGVDAAIRFGAMKAELYDESGVVIERVEQAYVPPSTVEVPGIPGPSGYVYVYIYNGVDGASSDLIARATEIIDGYYLPDGTRVIGYKAAGIVVTVYAVTVIQQGVEVTLTLEDNAPSTVSSSVNDVITFYLNNLNIAETLIRNEMIERIMSVAGVNDLVLTTPATNISAAVDEIITCGTVTIHV